MLSGRSRCSGSSRRSGLSAAELRREALGQGVERKFLADVDAEARARVLDELQRASEGRRVALVGIAGEVAGPVGGVDELAGAVGDAGAVAQPQTGQAQPQIDGRGALAPLGAAQRVLGLAQVAPALALGHELEL